MTMIRTEDHARLEQLEREVRDLRRLLAPPPPKPQPKIVEAGVRIHTALTINPGFTMPNDDELDRLLAIVLSALPALKPKPHRFDDGIDEFRGDFRSAFWALGALVRRADKPDTGRATSWWVDHVSEQLRVAGRRSISTGLPLVAACLAHGVEHTITKERFPHDVALGLAAYGGGKPCGNEWRKTLTSGRVRAASPLPAEYGRHPGPTNRVTINGR
jgi:hypothetical protein